MILIIGGAYQGNHEYAKERFGLEEDEICQIDKWMLSLIKEKAVKEKSDIDLALKKFIADNPEAVVICNDISCGVVPTDPVLREWREEVGRAMIILAQHAQEVIRVLCGIPTRIK